MKILIVSSLYGATGGGAGLIAYYVARGLLEAGHQPFVVTMGDQRQPSRADEDGIKIVRFKPANLYSLAEKDRHPKWQKLIWQMVDVYNLHCASVFRRLLLKETPDIVHIHKMRGFSGAVWSVSSHICPGRVIQTCHDYESMSPDGIMRGLVGEMALRKQWPVRGYQLIRARLSAGVSTITAPSSFTLKRIIDSGLFPSAKPAVVSNTHGWSQDQLRSIHQQRASFVPEGIRFLFLGRLEPEKGVVELCEAFMPVFKRHPSVQLDLAGWGTLDSELRSRYGNCANINFVGAVRGKAKEELLQNATVVVIPTLVEEVFGLVTVEAYAFGKPVIASNVGGLPELVRPGETGWLVEAGNLEALAEQMAAVVNMDPVFLEKLSGNCKEYSYAFSIEKIVAGYLDIYHQTIR